MTPKQIQRRQKSIENKINIWYDKLEELRSICTHTNVEKTHHADTGNYDSSQNSYWIDWNCPDCGKSWITDQ